MRIAAEWSHTPLGAIADELEVSRDTISNYLAGRTRTPRAVLIAWAFRTGVPLEWLLTGEEPQDNPGATNTIRYLTAA